MGRIIPIELIPENVRAQLGPEVLDKIANGTMELSLEVVDAEKNPERLAELLAGIEPDAKGSDFDDLSEVFGSQIGTGDLIEDLSNAVTRDYIPAFIRLEAKRGGVLPKTVELMDAILDQNIWVDANPNPPPEKLTEWGVIRERLKAFTVNSDGDENLLGVRRSDEDVIPLLKRWMEFFYPQFYARATANPAFELSDDMKPDQFLPLALNLIGTDDGFTNNLRKRFFDTANQIMNTSMLDRKGPLCNLAARYDRFTAPSYYFGAIYRTNDGSVTLPYVPNLYPFAAKVLVQINSPEIGWMINNAGDTTGLVAKDAGAKITNLFKAIDRGVYDGAAFLPFTHELSEAARLDWDNLPAADKAALDPATGIANVSATACTLYYTDKDHLRAALMALTKTFVEKAISASRDRQEI